MDPRPMTTHRLRVRAFSAARLPPAPGSAEPGSSPAAASPDRPEAAAAAPHHSKTLSSPGPDRRSPRWSPHARSPGGSAHRLRRAVTDVNVEPRELGPLGRGDLSFEGDGPSGDALVREEERERLGGVDSTLPTEVAVV